MERTLILGGGFGGLTVATELRSLLGDDHEIVLVDRSEHFLMGLRKLWALVGLGGLKEGTRSRRLLEGRGIRYVQQEIKAIEASSRTVRTADGPISADYLVVALGAVPRPDLVPGLAEHGFNVWDANEVGALIPVLEDFRGGRIAIVIAGVPYTCPPAPYECAMLIDDHLRERGVRDEIDLTMSTVQPILMPNAGTAGSTWVGEQLTARDIGFSTGRKVESVGANRVHYADGDLEFDVLIGVPPHRPPKVVGESDLTDGGVWVDVEPATLATAHHQVYAIGDVTRIELANGLALPKAGVIAELQGRRVAAAIAADVTGAVEPPPFDGRGFCYMEMGKTKATLIEGDFFASPEPQVELKDVSAAHAEQKHLFETERLDRWFGAWLGG